MKQLIKLMTKGLAVCMLLLLAMGAYAQQMDTYSYQRELQGITEQWHTIVLPDAIFGKISPNLLDIRIRGVSASNDTIEAPYLLQVAEEKLALKAVAFNRLNTAHNEAGYYFTFEVPTAEAINQLELNFEQQNFDWKLRLEGSQDQNEWFTIVEDYRILAIKNNNTDYHFSTINFPSSKYRYVRVFIASKEAPKLTTASITRRTLTEGTYRVYPIQTMEITQRREAKQTEIELVLPMPVPLSQLNIEVLDTFDYYRPLTIQYGTDSIQTEKGWRYNYRTLSSGTLNSMEANTFSLGTNTITRRLKILLHNQDNQALNIGTLTLKGYVHQLVARFQTPATYYLVYGNRYAAKPQYDIARFAEKIPTSTTALTLGPEEFIDQAAPEKEAPLFENKIFLWVLMIIIIAVLGGFTLKMMSGE